MSLTDERLAAIRLRYADKERSHAGLTSNVGSGPAIHLLQSYAVRAAASADDVPALLAEIAELKTTIEWAVETIKRLKQEIHTLLNPSSGMDVTYEGTVTIGEVTP